MKEESVLIKKEQEDSLCLNFFNLSEEQARFGFLSVSVQQEENELQNFDIGNSFMFGKPSIDKVLPIPRNMLSYDSDAFQLQDRQYQQKQSVKNDDQNEECSEIYSKNFMEEMNLNEFIKNDITNQNTKNVLRNFGNAQNHYCLYNESARIIVNQNISDGKKFDHWVRSLKLQNFQNFKNSWNSHKNRLFTRVYKKICWDFYTKHSIPYVLKSRIKKLETKNSHLRYIYRFLQGLENPEDFAYFKRI